MSNWLEMMARVLSGKLDRVFGVWFDLQPHTRSLIRHHAVPAVATVSRTGGCALSDCGEWGRSYALHRNKPAHGSCNGKIFF
jgi:hypothetical protein